VAASIHGKRGYAMVDGNLEQDPWIKIKSYLDSGEYGYFGCTVMPGPQLRQAITITLRIRESYPRVKIIWGGYFASNQYKSVLSGDAVDVIVNGPGDRTFPLLLDAMDYDTGWRNLPNLIYRSNGAIKMTARDELYDQDTLPDLPYETLNEFYPIGRYLGKTCLGSKTIAYHSSFGCPFTCSFCAVVPIYNARWKGKSAEKIYGDIRLLKEKYGGNAIEFHDNNFFVSEKRTVAFSHLMLNEGMKWWGEGRIDTLQKYSDDSLRVMRDSGCHMIFFGAESGNDAVLREMDKGGTQSGVQILEFAERMKKTGIIPEYSFVLGTPAPTEQEVFSRIRQEVEFIRKVKQVNPDTEIIIYLYSPVPTEGSEMFEEVKRTGFRFPEKLQDWLEPAWEKFDLRKNPLTPWLKPYMVDYINDFETVLNGYYPTYSDFKLTHFQRRAIRSISKLRYNTGFYARPFEIKALQKFWLRYRQPEWEGF
jgi:radical SAM superfamily enzyme YgiQ (UPF0313 family)